MRIRRSYINKPVVNFFGFKNCKSLGNMLRKHQSLVSLALYDGNPSATCGFPSQTSNVFPCHDVIIIIFHRIWLLSSQPTVTWVNLRNTKTHFLERGLLDLSTLALRLAEDRLRLSRQQRLVNTAAYMWNLGMKMCRKEVTIFCWSKFKVTINSCLLWEKRIISIMENRCRKLPYSLAVWAIIADKRRTKDVLMSFRCKPRYNHVSWKLDCTQSTIC